MSRTIGKVADLRVDPALKRLFEVLEIEEISMQKVERVAGLGDGTISKWQRRNGARLDNVRAALNAVGWELVAVPKTETSNVNKD